MPSAKTLWTLTPQLIADVTLYSTSLGGRKSPAPPGWGCPCCCSKSSPIVGYDGWPLLEDPPLAPGDQRRLGFVFLSGNEAIEVFRKAGKFFLWERGFIGEAIVVE
jgi:hypothetical protein